MAKSFKARYFRNSDIMVAEIGYRPSYVCRSLLRARDLIRKGLCWRVGDGKLIYVKDDHWIPKLPSFKSNICYLAGSSYKALTLMNGHDNWDEDAIRNLFPPVATGLYWIFGYLDEAVMILDSGRGLKGVCIR